MMTSTRKPSASSLALLLVRWAVFSPLVLLLLWLPGCHFFLTAPSYYKGRQHYRHHHRRTIVVGSAEKGQSDTTTTTTTTTTAAPIIDTFCDLLTESIQNQQLIDFALHGPKASSSSDDDDPTRTRGRLKRVQGRPIALKEKNHRKRKIKDQTPPTAPQQQRRCIQVTFKFHGATDVAKNYNENVVVDTVIRPLLEGRSVGVDSEWGQPAVEGAIGSTQYDSLQGARLETTTTPTSHQQEQQQQQITIWEWQAMYGKKQRLASRKKALKATPATTAPLGNVAAAAAAATTLQPHNRVKQRPLAPTDAVWSALGLTTNDGKPKPGKKAKLVQAQKFVEIVSRLVEQQQQPQPVASASNRNLRIFDMGCGRGYLTFALHAHLMQNLLNDNNYSDDRTTTTSIPPLVQTFGIDVRPKLVKDMNELAKSLDFKGLEFLQGTIEEYMVDNKNDKASMDNNDSIENESVSLKVWLALHACDTATDDALWSGIVQQADIIVVAPCCHKELRPQLDRSMPMPDVLRHGIFRQRWAATLTDSIRVVLLELAGYQVQVIEFVQTADTPQNVMITAVKQRGRNNNLSEQEDQARERLLNLAESHGVEHQALATWMQESLTSANGASQKIGLGRMPPLR